MNKRFARQFAWACLLAIAGFFFIVSGIDRIVVKGQSDQLQTVFRLYRDLDAQKSPTAALAKEEHMEITELSGTPKTQRQKLMQDLINRRRTMVGRSTIDITVNGQSEQLYIGELAPKQFVGVWQKKANVFTTAPQYAWVLALVYLLIVGTMLMWSLKRHRYWSGHVRQMAANLRRIRDDEPVEPLILTPDSPFIDMGAEVNHMEDAVLHLRTKVSMRQASFDRLIDHLPQGVMLIDSDQEVMLANQAMSALVGHPISPRKHNYLDDVKTYALARMIEHAFRKHKSHHKEISLMGTDKSVDANVIALTTATDRPQVLVILYDVTYLRQVEQMQLDFVGNVSHELKTPVTAITGFAETLLAGAKDDPETLTKFLTIIHDESIRLTQLIADILTLSRPQDAKPKHEPVAIGDLVAQGLQSLSQTIDDKQLKIDNRVSQNLVVASDDVKISQVVRNLLNNAVFYNRQRGSVTIAAKADDDQLTLTVADTGIGIATKDQKRIFERFYRVDKARSRHNGGTGLGLAIVAETLQQLGGDIDLQSQVGVGTTFTITVPLQ